MIYDCFVSLSIQAIGYDFEYDEYHRYMPFFSYCFYLHLLVVMKLIFELWLLQLCSWEITL